MRGIRLGHRSEVQGLTIVSTSLIKIFNKIKILKVVWLIKHSIHAQLKHSHLNLHYNVPHNICLFNDGVYLVSIYIVVSRL